MTETSETPPAIITPALLRALGSEQETIQFENGDSVDIPKFAQLWGVELTDGVEPISNHSFLAGRTAWNIGTELKKAGVAGYENLNVEFLTQGAIIHDILKLPSRFIAKLPANQQDQLESPDDMTSRWLEELEFPKEVQDGIRAHDFPEAVIDNPYWKIIVLSDAMAGEHIMPVKERLIGVRARYPDVTKERFDAATHTFNTLADEIFGALGTNDEGFIAEHELTDDKSMPKWERFLRRQRALGREKRTTEVMTMLESLSKRP